MVQINSKCNTYWEGDFIISDYIPYLRWVTKLQRIGTSLQALRNELSKFITQIMDEHKQVHLLQIQILRMCLKILWMFFSPHLKKMVLDT
ncbi:hypothetical protein CY35_08G120300 [Sphagnum magellanicum]|nr:hypothetical protein CY35_08G120300 [Sphagnum magellanicum]